MSQPSEEQRREWEEKIKTMSPEELQQLQKQQCIFCQIVAGKVSSKKVYEDSTCLAILDINPAAKGHILLLPKEHYMIMPQVPEKVLRHISIVTKNLSQVLLKVMRADGTTVFIANGAAAGQRAQHFLIHLIPRKAGDDLLQIEERLIGQEMAMKVKAAIDKKLFDLLGGKKAVSKEKEESKKEETKEVKAQKATEELVAKPAPSKSKKSKKQSPNKISEAKQGTVSKTKRGREASLDDIANLFK